MASFLRYLGATDAIGRGAAQIADTAINLRQLQNQEAAGRMAAQAQGLNIMSAQIDLKKKMDEERMLDTPMRLEDAFGTLPDESKQYLTQFGIENNLVTNDGGVLNITPRQFQQGQKLINMRQDAKGQLYDLTIQGLNRQMSEMKEKLMKKPDDQELAGQFKQISQQYSDIVRERQGLPGAPKPTTLNAGDRSVVNGVVLAEGGVKPTTQGFGEVFNRTYREIVGEGDPSLATPEQAGQVNQLIELRQGAPTLYRDSSKIADEMGLKGEAKLNYVITKMAKAAGEREEAVQMGRPIPAGEIAPVSALRNGVRIAQALKSEFTPEERADYVGYLKLPAERLAQVTNNDPKFAKFSALVAESKGWAFAEGGKALTPFEAGVVFGYIPTGREFSPADFEAKLEESVTRSEFLIDQRIGLATTPKGKLGSSGGQSKPSAPKGTSKSAEDFLNKWMPK